jgi:hypothetical protein
MAQQREPAFGVTPVVFNDAQGTDSLYVPSAAQLDADEKALTYKGGALQKAPAEGWRVTQLRLMNVDSSNAVVASLWVGSAYNALRFIGAISVAAKAGTDGLVAANNALNSSTFPDLPKDAAGNPFLEIGSGETLFITSATADKLKSMMTAQTYAAPA